MKINSLLNLFCFSGIFLSQNVSEKLAKGLQIPDVIMSRSCQSILHYYEF